MRLRDLPGLGAKSEASLKEVGIETPDQLRAVGAIDAYLRLQQCAGTRPSLNFLYALVGALEQRHWTEVAKTDRDRLLFELEGRAELDKLASRLGGS